MNNTKVCGLSFIEMSYASIAVKSEADNKSTRLSHDYTEVVSIHTNVSQETATILCRPALVFHACVRECEFRLILFCSYRFERAITVIVGPTKQRFVIHENLVRYYSEYFDAALKSDFKEASSNTFELIEDNASVFAGFVHYLYTKQLKCNEAASIKEKEMFLVESYLLGERRGSVGYRNAVISALKNVWKLSTGPTLGSIILAFNESIQHSKLRQLIVDKCAWEGSAEGLKVEIMDRDAMLPGFGLELSLALLKRINSAVSLPLDSVCPSRRQFTMNHHFCYCSHDFMASSDPNCNSHSTSGIHTCKHCTIRKDVWQEQAGGPKLGLEKEAPYNERFCAEYHEHEDDVTCKNGELSSETS